MNKMNKIKNTNTKKSTKYYNKDIIEPLYLSYTQEEEVEKKIEIRNSLSLLLLPFLEGVLQAHYKYLLYYPPDLYEDLRQSLFISLLSGLDTYNKEKGTTLFTWLNNVLHGAIMNLYTNNKNNQERKAKIERELIRKEREDENNTPSYLNFLSLLDEIEIDFDTWNKKDIEILHTLREIAGEGDSSSLLYLTHETTTALSSSLEELRHFKKMVSLLFSSSSSSSSSSTSPK